MAALLLLVAGCGGGGEPAPSSQLDRETFIATYVDLRNAALAEDDMALDAETRTRILESHGVTQEDLLDFAEVRGTDLEFIREVWDEVERRMNPLDADVTADTVRDEGGA